MTSKASISASVWKWLRAVLLLVAGVAIFSRGGHAVDRDNRVERYATRKGDVIQLHPSDTVFRVPESWREHGRFLLTSRDIRKAGKRLGIEIADGALQWRDCTVQVETNDLRWLRAYVVDGDEEEILKRIHEKGWAAAAKIPSYMRYDGHVTSWGASLYEFKTAATKEGPWVHVDIPYSLDFGDYTEDGYVSFYLRPVAGRELVIAVGYSTAGGARTTDERQNILKSVVLHDSPDQTGAQ